MAGSRKASNQKISVPGEVFSDLIRQKGLIVLLLINCVTALAVVQVSYQSRQKVIEQDKLMQARDALDVEWRHLILEQRTLAEHSRVEDVAIRKLDMFRPKPAQEVVVKL